MLVNQKTKMILILTMTIFLLCGCVVDSKEDGGESVDELYSETVIKLPDEINYISDFRKMSNGEIYAVGLDKTNKKISLWKVDINNNKWLKVDDYSNKLGFEIEKNMELRGFLQPDGSLAFMVTRWTVDILEDSYTEYYTINKDEEVKQILTNDKSESEHSGEYVDETGYFALEFTDSGNIIPITMTDVVCKVNEDFQSEGELFQGLKAPYMYSVSGDTVYGMNAVQYEEIDILSNTESENALLKYVSSEIGSDLKYGESAFSYINDGEKSKCFFISDKGMWKFMKKGNEFIKHKIINGEQSAIGIADKLIHKYVAIDENTLLLTQENEEGFQFLKFTKSAESSKHKKEIIAYSLYEDEKVTKLLNSFQQNNNDISIKYEYGIKNDNTTVTDEINKLNTKILSGEGPDILFLDNINFRNYKDKDLLVELSDLALDNNSNLLSNITSIYTDDDKVYAVPCSFSYIVISGDYGVTSSRSEFDKLCKYIVSNKYTLPEDSFNNFAVLSYKAYLEANINKDKGYTTEQLNSFYQNLKQIYTLNGNSEYVSFDNQNLVLDSHNGYLETKEDANKVSLDSVMTLAQIQQVGYLSENGVNIEILLDQSKSLFIPSQVLSINARSENKEEAMELIEYAMSIEGQEAISNYCIPISETVLLNKLNNLSMQIIVNPHSDSGLEIPALSSESRRIILNQIKKINNGLADDNLVMEIVMFEAQEYLNGVSTLKEAVGNTIDRLELLHAEQ